jgi:methylenetetrahydrofolate reductase (NADPH)
MMDPSEPIAEVLQRRTPVLSVEFFPPKDDKGGEQLLEVAESLRSAAAPDFVSITYGAGGTTRERTIRYAGLLKDMFGFNVMPHLTCVGSSRAELHQLLDGYAEAGFRNIMALRGDPPKGESTFQPHPDGLPYACDLVELIAKYYPQFSIGVAGYPEVHPEATSAGTTSAT